MSSTEKNKRKRAAFATSNGGPEGAPPQNGPQVRFQVEDRPVRRRIAIPDGFAPVQQLCVVDPANVATGREELWLIQLPNMTAMQDLAAAGTLEVDLSARPARASAHAAGPSGSVPTDTVASFNDRDGESYRLVLEAPDVALQLVAVCPLQDEEGSAEAAPIVRRLTVVRAIAPPQAGSTAGEAEDEAAALDRLQASLAVIAAARQEAAAVAAAEGGSLLPSAEAAVPMEVDEATGTPAAAPAAAATGAGTGAGAGGRAGAADGRKDGKDKHKGKDKDKDADKRKGKDGDEGKVADKKKSKDKDKDKHRDKDRGRHGDQAKTPAAPPAAAAAAVKEAPATAPPAMRPMEAGTAAADVDKKKEKKDKDKKKDKEKKDKEKKDKDKSEKSKDKSREGVDLKTPAAAPTAPAVNVKGAPATAPPAMRPLDAATTAAAASAGERKDKDKKDKHKDKDRKKEKEKKDKKKDKKDKQKRDGSSGSDSD